MTIDTRPLEVTNFDGGITDYFIDGPINQAEVMDNLFINTNRKPRTRPGSTPYVDEQIPLGQKRISNLTFLSGTLLAFANQEVYYDSTGWTEITGPTSGNLLPAGDDDTLTTIAKWQDHIFISSDENTSIQKMYIDSGGTIRVRNAGLPEIPAGFSVTDPSGSGETYLYAACFKFTYTVGDRTYVDRGPVFELATAVTGGAITSGNAATVTLPTSLTTVENWDESSIEIEVYRTISGGTTFYLVSTESLGTSSFDDEVEDADLQNNLLLYTTGDVVSNDTPPKAKYVHVVNDTGYYGWIKDGSEERRYDVRQSVPGDPDSVPESFFAETEFELMGVYSIYDRPLVFTTRFIYRIDSFFSNTGVGGMDLRKIDDEAGCASQNSIVATHKGVFWAGNVGFYWSDGFRVEKISDHLNETYKSFVLNTERASRIFGTYDSSNERIYWSVSQEDGNNEPDRCFVLDLKFPFLPAPSEGRMGGVFTTMSSTTYFRPTSLVFDDTTGNLYRGDTRGYVLRHGTDLFTDAKIDTAVSPGSWEELTIVHNYKSCFLDFDSKFMRKFVPRLLVSAANTTNLSLAIASSNDNNRVTGDLKPIRYRNNITWGEDLPPWGDEDSLWNSQGLIEEWRRFPARGLRCNYKQIQLTNAQVQLFTSDVLGTVTVDQSALTATLGGSFTWPSAMVDYVIKFENDDYTEEFVISARTSTVVTFLDPNGRAPVDGTYQFVVEGKPKGEVLELNGYVLHWAYLSKSHTPFSAASLGSNP